MRSQEQGALGWVHAGACCSRRQRAAPICANSPEGPRLPGGRGAGGWDSQNRACTAPPCCAPRDASSFARLARTPQGSGCCRALGAPISRTSGISECPSTLQKPRCCLTESTREPRAAWAQAQARAPACARARGEAWPARRPVSLRSYAWATPHHALPVPSRRRVHAPHRYGLTFTLNEARPLPYTACPHPSQPGEP